MYVQVNVCISARAASTSFLVATESEDLLTRVRTYTRAASIFETAIIKDCTGMYIRPVVNKCVRIILTHDFLARTE